MAERVIDNDLTHGPPSPTAGCAGWRKQALDWLRADLALRAGLANSSIPDVRRAVGDGLRQWQADKDLSGLRDATVVARLPAAEQVECKKFWADVQALLDTVEPKK